MKMMQYYIIQNWSITILMRPMIIALLYHYFGERGFSPFTKSVRLVKYHFFNDSHHYFSDTYDKYHQNSDKARSQIKEIESATC